MSRLILVSHRLPTGVQAGGASGSGQRAAGGLVSALLTAWSGTDSVWIGVPGSHESGSLPSRLIGVRLSKSEQRRYYEGFSNGVLWPLFHYFTESMRFEAGDYDAYRLVNERFADSVVAEAKPGE